jgi:pantothenate kinase
MSEKSKMTQEEVTELRQLNEEVYRSLLEIGDISAGISRLEKSKQAALFNHETCRHKLKTKQEELIDVYGETNVNLGTGELAPIDEK